MSRSLQGGVSLVGWRLPWSTVLVACGCFTPLTGAAQTTCGAGEPEQYLPLREGVLPQLHRLPNGQDAILATRSGWVMRVDLVQGRVTAAFKADAAFTSTALSPPRGDGSALLMAASEDPPALLMFTEDLQLTKTLVLSGAAGELASGVLPVVTAPERSSFIAALKGVAEVWEISYDPKAPEIGLGLVHDFQYREGHFVRGYLNPRRTTFACPAQALALSPDGHEVLTVHDCADKPAPEATVTLQITHLDVRKPTSKITLPCKPTTPSPLVWRDAAALASAVTRLDRAAGACKLP